MRDIIVIDLLVRDTTYTQYEAREREGIVILHVVNICVGTCICDRHFVLSPCQIS